jgi:hypothetical protein
MKDYAADSASPRGQAQMSREPTAELVEAQLRHMERIAGVICEEELLERPIGELGPMEGSFRTISEALDAIECEIGCSSDPTLYRMTLNQPWRMG